MRPEEYQISSELFKLHSEDTNLHDEKLKTKPVSYFKDALYRFTRNKASIVAFFIIAILFLFAIFVPMFCTYEVSDQDENFAYCLPKSKLMYNIGANFWDGCSNKTLSEEAFLEYKGIGDETGLSPIKNNEYERFEEEQIIKGKKQKIVSYKFRLDSYYAVGMKYMNLTDSQYKAIQDYQNRTGEQIIYPIVNVNDRPTSPAYKNNANYWYKTKDIGGNKVGAALDADGNFQINYRPYSGIDEYNSLRIEENNATLYDYAIKNQTGWEVRICYYRYYKYYHAEILKDGIEEPCFAFGATNVGRDVLSSLANGARFSFILSILVSVVNLVVGAIIGACEGYYGGIFDLIFERFSDILGSIPFMVVISLLKFKVHVSQIVILLISFFATGWMGMAGSTRMQFYRFKNQEYVLVSRTLGAKDRRVMFKHIFPNAIGTLITGCVLTIPSVIFSETSLSYLGIINLETGGVTSVGTLLSKGQQYLFTFPHMIIFPSIFISLLMLSFNLFGNGLRDAFNPSLRGTED